MGARKERAGAARKEGAKNAQGARRGAAGLQGAAAAGGGGCGRGGAGGRRGGAGGGAWRSRRPPPPPLPCAPLGPAPLRSSLRSAPAPLSAPHGPALRYGPAAPMFTGGAPARLPLSSAQGRGVQRWGGGWEEEGGERAPSAHREGKCGAMRMGVCVPYFCISNEKKNPSVPRRGGGGRDGPNPQRSARAPLRSAARGCEPGALKEGGG